MVCCNLFQIAAKESPNGPVRASAPDLLTPSGQRAGQNQLLNGYAVGS